MSDHGTIAAVLDLVDPRLQGIREDRGVTLIDLAECTGISKTTYGPTGEGADEVLSILGRPGERMHVRARSRRGESAG